MARVTDAEALEAFADRQKLSEPLLRLAGDDPQPRADVEPLRHLEGGGVVLGYAGELERVGRLGELAALGLCFGQAGENLRVSRLAAQGHQGVDRDRGVGLGLGQVAAAQQGESAEGGRARSVERHAAPARVLEPVRVVGYGQVELVEREKHRHSHRLRLPDLVAEQRPAGKRTVDQPACARGLLTRASQLGGGECEQDAAVEAVLARSGGGPFEPRPGDRVQVRIEAGQSDELRLESLRGRVVGSQAVDPFLQDGGGVVLAAFSEEGAAERERGLDRTRLATQELVGLFEASGGRHAGSQLRNTELEHHLPAQIGTGRLGEGALEIGPGGVGRVPGARGARGVAKGGNDGCAAPRGCIEEVDGCPSGVGVAAGEQLGRTLVLEGSLGVAQVGVHGGSQDRVHESQPPARAQDLDPGERCRHRRCLLGIELGERGGRRELAVVSQNRHGTRERLSLGTETLQSPHHGAGEGSRAHLRHAGSGGRVRLDAFGKHGPEQFVHHQRVAAASDVDRPHELRLGIAVERLLDESLHGLEAQRSRRHDRGMRRVFQLADDRRIHLRLSAPNRDGEQHRQPVEPASEVRQEVQGGPIAPLEIVDGEQRGRSLGEVHGQPEESVQRGERDPFAVRGGLTILGEPEQRRGETRRPRQQRRPLRLVAGRKPRLEELAHHPMGEAALELAATGAQHLEATGLGMVVAGHEQP